MRRLNGWSTRRLALASVILAAIALAAVILAGVAAVGWWHAAGSPSPVAQSPPPPAAPHSAIPIPSPSVSPSSPSFAPGYGPPVRILVDPNLEVEADIYGPGAMRVTYPCGSTCDIMTFMSPDQGGAWEGPALTEEHWPDGTVAVIRSKVDTPQIRVWAASLVEKTP